MSVILPPSGKISAGAHGCTHDPRLQFPIMNTTSKKLKERHSTETVVSMYTNMETVPKVNVAGTNQGLIGKP